MKWQDNPTVANLRIDPLETSNTYGTRFVLHDVKLTANPEPTASNQFTTTFILKDPENSPVTVSFFLDNDNVNYIGKYIGSKTYWPGVYDYQFKTCGLNTGNHYLYAVLTDSIGNVTSHYADAPITIKAATDNCSTSIPSINSLLLH